MSVFYLAVVKLSEIACCVYYHFNLVSALYRSNSTREGSCLCVKKDIVTKVVNYLKELGEENNSEMSLSRNKI